MGFSFHSCHSVFLAFGNWMTVIERLLTDVESGESGKIRKAALCMHLQQLCSQPHGEVAAQTQGIKHVHPLEALPRTNLDDILKGRPC